MNGVFHQLALGINKAEVNAPGVNTDAVKAACHTSLDDALLNLVEETKHIPINRTADTYGVIRKAVNLLKGDFLTVEATDNRTSA